MPTLKPIQHNVVALMAAGFTAAAAAREAGVHRHTVANWLQHENFRSALESARGAKKVLDCEHADALAANAIATLDNLMSDAKAPGVRLRAAIAVLENTTIFHNGLD